MASCSKIRKLEEEGDSFECSPTVPLPDHIRLELSTALVNLCNFDRKNNITLVPYKIRIRMQQTGIEEWRFRKLIVNLKIMKKVSY